MSAGVMWIRTSEWLQKWCSTYVQCGFQCLFPIWFGFFAHVNAWVTCSTMQNVFWFLSIFHIVSTYEYYVVGWLFAWPNGEDPLILFTCLRHSAVAVAIGLWGCLGLGLLFSNFTFQYAPWSGWSIFYTFVVELNIWRYGFIVSCRPYGNHPLVIVTFAPVGNGWLLHNVHLVAESLLLFLVVHLFRFDFVWIFGEFNRQFSSLP